MQRIWERFPKAFAAIAKAHEEVGLVHHHDIHHAMRVGEMAWQCAIAEWQVQETAALAGLAGLCHNADRIIQARQGLGRNKPPEESTRQLICGWLRLEDLTQPNRWIIRESVLRHDHPNDSHDFRVQIALMDGDRVVNLDLDVVMRAAQYHADIPPVDFRHRMDDPAATFQHPRSVLRDVGYCLEWAEDGNRFSVRTALGRRLATARAEAVRSYLAQLERQHAEEGLLPYPL